MIDSIVHYKWLLFITSELLCFLAISLFFICRYWWNFQRMMFIPLILLLLSEIWLLAIAILDYKINQTINWFHIVIFCFLLYGVTIGKKDIKDLDRRIYRKVRSLKAKRDQKRLSS
ncbi:hypothetical protein FZC66_11030 [Priestia megaterium]|nr:hypothetical protein FZC66_11030 [Priestia megaterium]